MSLSFFVKRQLLPFVMVLSLLPLCGCVFLVGAGLGALGGFVASPDTVEGMISERDIDEVWSATIEIVTIMGLIEDRIDAEYSLQADIFGATVNIMAMPMGESSVRLRVKARKNMLPKIRIAQDVYIKIANHLLN